MSKSVKATQVYEAIRKYLKDNDFKFEPHDEDLVFTFTVQGDDLPQPTVVRVIDERDLIQVISPIPVSMPEDKRYDAAVAVAVVNDKILNGSFDLDIGDGRITCRVTQCYTGCEITDDLLKYILGVTFVTTDKYNDRFFMLAKGMLSLEQFIESVS